MMGADASFDKYSMVSRLKHMIAKGHGKSKGAAVLCLSKVSEGGKVSLCY